MEIHVVILILFSPLFLILIQSGALAQVPPTTVSIAPGSSDPSTPSPYYPSPVSLVIGSTVMWTNNDAVYHTATSSTGSFDSGLIAPNGSWNWTPPTAGYFSYYCKLHPYMNGAITVS